MSRHRVIPRRYIGVTCTIVGCMLAGTRPLEAQHTVATERQADDRSSSEVFARPISVSLNAVPLAQAIDAIAEASKVSIQYRLVMLEAYAKPVSIHAKGLALGVVLERVLDGTPLRAVPNGQGDITILGPGNADVANRADSTGTIAGDVVDSASGKRLNGVSVQIEGTKRRTTTNTDGHFILHDVPSGEWVLTTRLFGYRPLRQTVTVNPDASASVRLRMPAAPNVLTQVVTTATGTQRRLEVGSDVTVLNVDSVMRAAPIRSVTDLLEGRVPGLFLQHSSGQPGAPSRVRMRGASSITRSNDMIVFVDGIRVYAEQSNNRNLNTSAKGASYSVQSPLDQIDPNSIETLEVLKGPSASAIYGSDAANGVIVITTKRGKGGATHWDLVANQGLSFLPGKYPVQQYRMGHYVNGGPTLCFITDFDCMLDSVITFQALNDPRYTVIDGHGPLTDVSTSVSGGNTVTYQLTGRILRQTGLFKLPDIETERFTKFHGGATPPQWMVHPDHYNAQSATSRIDLPLGQGSTQVRVSLLNMLSTSDKQTSSLQNALGQLAATYVDTSLLGREPLIANFSERATTGDLHSTNGLNAEWGSLETSRLLLHLDAGIDLLNTTNEAVTPRGYELTATDSIGSFSTSRVNTQERTVNLRASTRMPLVDWNAGFNLDNHVENDIAGKVIGIPAGVLSPSLLGPNATQVGVTTSTYGWYVEPHLRFSSRFFVTPSLRLDGGSASGSRVSWGGLSGVSGFPKMDFSWLAVDRSDGASRGILPALTSLRLHGAFGTAGVQPDPAANLRLLSLATARADSQTIDLVRFATLGNTKLRPERKRELEAGVDLALWDRRLQLAVTGHQDMQYDAILPIPVAPSIPDLPYYKNIGQIRNTGMDITTDAVVVDRNAVGWTVHATVTTLANKVISLVPGQAPIDDRPAGLQSPLVTRIIPGFPLYSRWAPPILGYADRDHNGVITPDEVLVGDSLRYIGQEAPNYQLSFSTSITLFDRRVSISSDVLYQNGMTQMNEVNSRIVRFIDAQGREYNNILAGKLLYANDKNTPLSQQAAFAAYNPPSGFVGTGYGFAQVVNTLRWQSLSVNYYAPRALARWVRASNVSFAVQAKNLGLHTNYRGKDPDVSAFPTGETVMDSGQLPEPRTVSFQIRLGN